MCATICPQNWPESGDFEPHLSLSRNSFAYHISQYSHVDGPFFRNGSMRFISQRPKMATNNPQLRAGLLRPTGGILKVCTVCTLPWNAERLGGTRRTHGYVPDRLFFDSGLGYRSSSRVGLRTESACCPVDPDSGVRNDWHGILSNEGNLHSYLVLRPQHCILDRMNDVHLRVHPLNALRQRAE